MAWRGSGVAGAGSIGSLAATGSVARSGAGRCGGVLVLDLHEGHLNLRLRLVEHCAGLAEPVADPFEHGPQGVDGESSVLKAGGWRLRWIAPGS